MAINFASATVKATNHPNKRTLGAHLGDVFNVKGFGAVGNQVADDTAKIQAAVDACIAAGGGTVYFPLGSPGYITTAPITFDNDDEVGIRFLGEGPGSFILGNFNGFIFDRFLATPNNTRAHRIIERMGLTNTHATGGCIRIGSTIGAAVRSCTLSAHVCITTEDAVGVSSRNLQIQDCLFTGRGNYTGGNAVIIGGGGSITGSDVHGCNVGYRCYGSGLFIGGGRIERCSVAHLYGLDSGDNDVGLTGLSVAGHTFEGNWTATDFAGTVSGFHLAGIANQGHDLTNSGPTGLTGQPAAKGQEYGIRVRADKASNGVFSGMSGGNHHDIAVFSMADSTNRANIFMTGCTMSQSGGTGVAWDLPDEAHTMRFINCNTAQTHTFAQLPPSPLEGEEYSITDGSTATWGATVAGGGSENVMVRYNGTNWTVVGA